MNIKEYFASLFKGAYSLIQGMEVTGKELFTKKVTEQYPENRATLHIPERFRATLQFIYDEDGNHKCTACKSTIILCFSFFVRVFFLCMKAQFSKSFNKVLS